MPRTRLSERLQDLLLENEVLEDFLRQLSGLVADLASAETGCRVLCSARVVRPRQSVTFGASDADALALDKLQDDFADAPGPAALKNGHSAVVPGASLDQRGRRYRRAAAQRGIRSMLGVSVLAERGAAAALTLFSPAPEAFDDAGVAAGEDLAARVGKVMSLAVRLESAQGLNRDLLQAMRSRTAINLATGILMAQSRCSQPEAFELLLKVSNTRNIKLRIVAEEILRRFEGGPAGAVFSA
jgi:hypothetical protein